MDRIQFRRDTLDNWNRINPILLEGEIGYVLDDPNLYKMGDGVHTWDQLPFRGFDGTIVQETGSNENAVMSQKAISVALSAIQQQVEEIVTSLDDVDFVNPETIDGYYLSGNSSTYNPNESFKYSKPFLAKANSIVKIKARGSGTVVNILSSVTDISSERPAYKEVVRCTDSTYKWYESEIKTDTYLIACGNKDSEFLICVIDKSKDKTLQDELSELQGNAEVNYAEELSLSFIEGYYLSGNSSIFNPNSSFKYARVYVDAPCKLYVKAKGYSTVVNIISKSYFKVNDVEKQQCKYIESVRCIDSNLRLYEYDAKESGYYYICGDKNHTLKAYISKDTNIVRPNMLGMFNRVMTLGDSLSVGLVYESASQYYQSNGTIDQVIARTCGLKSFYVAQGGITPKGWWDKYIQGGWNNTVSGNLPESERTTDALNVNSFYVVFLGTNKTGGIGITDTLDTDCNGSNIANFADNDTGSYGKILQTLYNNNKTAVLVIPPLVSDEAKDAIINFSLKYGFPYIVLPDLSAPIYHRNPFDYNYIDGVHYNDMGYACIGNAIVVLINNMTENSLYKLILRHRISV